MRLATFNLNHGRSLTDGRVDETRIVEAVASLDADVMAIQEVDRDQPRSHGLDLTALTARAVGAPYQRFVATMVGTPGTGLAGPTYRAPTHSRDGIGEPCYGIGLVSRWPVRDWRVLRLRASPFPFPVALPMPGGRTRVVLLRDEPRAVVAAVLETPRGPMTVAGTHLSFVPGWNIGHLVRALRWLRFLPGPRLLLGDLNLPGPVAAATARLLGWRLVGRAKTFPSAQPRIQLDHALITTAGGNGAATVSTPRVAISDHRPLVVDLG